VKVFVTPGIVPPSAAQPVSASVFRKGNSKAMLGGRQRRLPRDAGETECIESKP